MWINGKHYKIQRFSVFQHVDNNGIAFERIVESSVNQGFPEAERNISHVSFRIIGDKHGEYQSKDSALSIVNSTYPHYPHQECPRFVEEKTRKKAGYKNDPIVFPCVIPTKKQFLTNKLYHNFQGL